MPVESADESALAVGDGDVEAIHTSEERTFAGLNGEVDPAIFELAGGIMGERGDRPLFIGGDDETALEQRLEAVADAEDQPFAVAELAECVAEKVGELIREDLAGGHVISISEPARNDEDLVVPDQGRRLAEPIDVDALGHRTGLLEGELGLGVTVRPWTAKDENSYRGHDWVSIEYSLDPETGGGDNLGV